MSGSKLGSRGSIVLVAAAAFLLSGLAALGDDHQPPTVILRVGARQQAGATSTGQWSSPIPPPQGAPPGVYCGAWTWDPAPYPYPRALRVRPGFVTALVEFHKSQAPRNVSIRGWTVVEKDGDRRGQRAIAYTLRPVEEGGQVTAWVAEARFRVKRHLYLDASAEWTEEEGQGCMGQQNATWNFHVKARRA